MKFFITRFRSFQVWTLGPKSGGSFASAPRDIIVFTYAELARDAAAAKLIESQAREINLSLGWKDERVTSIDKGFFNRTVLLALDSKLHLAGYLVMDEEGYISSIAVSKALQGQGIGGMLFDSAMEYAQGSGQIRELSVYNVGANGFIEVLGRKHKILYGKSGSARTVFEVPKLMEKEPGSVSARSRFSAWFQENFPGKRTVTREAFKPRLNAIAPAVQPDALVTQVLQKIKNDEPVSLYFVCTANKNRSAVAHILSAHQTREQGKNNVSIDSGGILTRVIRLKGKAIDPEYYTLLNEKGIPVDIINSFQSTPINRNAVNKADIIIVASPLHAKIIGRRFPETKNKIRLFTELHPDLRQFGDVLPDPEFGKVTKKSLLVLLEGTIIPRLFGGDKALSDKKTEVGEAAPVSEVENRRRLAPDNPAKRGREAAASQTSETISIVSYQDLLRAVPENVIKRELDEVNASVGWGEYYMTTLIQDALNEHQVILAVDKEKRVLGYLVLEADGYIPF
ncbi:MAG: GNAT family N-acetyltransferase, partial [Candidatus Firestonebacteria bacterium]|nr:GNAT family N-acetyltransferase [Candidatus Firestonebacteria bacterium]